MGFPSMAVCHLILKMHCKMHEAIMRKSVVVVWSTELAGKGRRNAPCVVVVEAEAAQTAIATKADRRIFVAAGRLYEAIQTIRLTHRGWLAVVVQVQPR